jgi:4-amino-4-deoxy-L-arabinose transferase-like glycosyltransferase
MFDKILASIIIAYLVMGVLYAYLTPHWQVPDEPAHYNYVKYLAENRRLPVLKMGDYPHEYLEELKEKRFPPDMSIAPLRYEFHQPPLYYIISAPFYKLFAGKLLPLRLLSTLFCTLLLYISYRIVKDVFHGEEALALGTVAFVAFVPMHIAMTAAVNNDALAELILAGVFWMLVRYIKKERGYGWLIGLGVLTGLGMLTKTTTYISIPLVLIALAMKRFRRGGYSFLLSSSLFLLTSFSFALPWFIRNALIYGDFDFLGLKRHDAIVVGQPRTADWIALYGTMEVIKRFAITTFQSFWAQFGWMGILVDVRIYFGLALLCTFSAIGFTIYIVRALRERELLFLQRDAILLMALSSLFSLLSYLWYNTKFVQHQGRYLFTALVPFGLFFSLGLREILNRGRARWMALFLLISVLALIAKGFLTGDLNKLSLIFLGGACLAFGVKALIPPKYDDVIFALPYLGLFCLDVVCLFGFIVPYFGSR